MALTRIKTKEAARQLGMSDQALRQQMQRGLLPIGEAVKGTGENYTYYIYQEWIDRYAEEGWKGAGAQPVGIQ